MKLSVPLSVYESARNEFCLSADEFHQAELDRTVYLSDGHVTVTEYVPYVVADAVCCALADWLA